MTLIGSVFRQFAAIPSLPSASLKGQTVFITGANTGIGLETARQCVGLGADRVILAVRTLSTGEAAKASIQKSFPSSTTKIDVWNLDLQSFESVLEVGKRAAAMPRLNVALLNAGVFPFEWRTSSNGFETGLQVNHLATALLALALIPTLKRTSRDQRQPSRLTFTSAEAHDLTKFSEQSAEKTLEKMNNKEFYNGPIDRYCTSKLVNIFWVRELASRTSRNEVIVNFFNPGAVDTGYVYSFPDLARHLL
jgi:retinol dehydrogenase 12